MRFSFSLLAALFVVFFVLVHSADAQPDGSVGYWAGERGEALDLAIKEAGNAPPAPTGPFVRPDPNWGKEPVEELTPKRGRVVLRGSWNFTPEPGAGWQVVERENFATRRMEPRVNPPWTPMRKVVWYGRNVHIPAQWSGRRIALDFKQVNRTALVFANDKPCGVVNLAGSVDITDAVTPGQDAKITIWMQNAPDVRPHSVYAGLVGDIHLISYPPGARVTDVHVIPSVRKRDLTLEVEVSYLDHAGPLQLRAEMVNAQGQVEKTFTSTVQARSAPSQVLTVSWPWEDPTLWDIGKPNLYQLRLAVQGQGIDDNYHQEFGFRELWLDGRKIFLNGTEVHLRTIQGNWLGSNAGRYQLEGIEGINTGADLRAYFDLLQHLGVNFIHWTPSGAWPSMQREVAILASQRGFLMAGQIPSVRSFADDAAKERFVSSVTFVQRQMRNFPAVVAWVSSGPPSMPGQDQNPYNIGRPRSVAGPNPEVYHLQKSVDAAQRPIYWHAFTHGDIMSANWYLNFIPMQEREDWISHWVEHGDVPYHGSEFGMPFNYTFMRKRTHEHNSPNPIQEEPFIIEYAAGWLGPSIYYDLKQVEWRFANWGWNDTGNANVPAATPNTFKGVGMLIHNSWAERNLPLFQRILDGWPERTWRAWRTYGFNMMPIPWWSELTGGRPIKDGAMANRPEDFHPKHESFRRASQPTLAWIAGPREEFTRKDHSFWGGRPMPAKNLVLINDTRDPQHYEFTWTVRVGGQDAATGRVEGVLEISERKFEPITATLPTVHEKSDGIIEIRGKIGEVEHTDTFVFRVFPPMQPARGTVRIWDPVGKTSQMLTALGYQTTEWDGQPTDQLVIVGREALRSGIDAMPGSLLDFVANGGRVLVMPHHPDWVEQQLGMRVSKFMSRQVFRVHESHPVVAGLDDEDLRDWGGASTLVEPYPKEYREKADYGMPAYGWKWGNRGGISSGAPEAPHQAGWRPILVAEFGLQYAPLMELDYGKGRVVWCSVDLEDYVPHEPVAVVLARQLIEYAATAPLSPRLPTYAVGLDPTQASLLRRLGVIHQTSRDLPENPALVIIGGRSRLTDEQMQTFAEKGGRLFFLATGPESDTLGVGFRFVQETTPNLLWPHLYPDVFGVERGIWKDRNEPEGKDVPVPDWPELAGLTVADFHRRGFVDHYAVNENCEPAMLGWVGRKRIGQGVAIFCQVDPESLDVQGKPYFRLTRWRQTRVLAQMLANAGAQFTLDQGLLTLRKPSEIDGGSVAGYYHPDYRADHHRGDNPFRYWRW